MGHSDNDITRDGVPEGTVQLQGVETGGTKSFPAILGDDWRRFVL